MLCALALSSCASRKPAETTAEMGVSIATFGVSLAPETSETLPETIATDIPVISETSLATTAATERSYKTAASTTKSPETENASKESSGYDIIDSSKVMYASSSVNVRELPDADSDRVGHLDKGDKVNVTGIVSNGWVRIEYKDSEYFVNGSYLEEREPEVTSLPETKPAATTEPPVTAPPETTALPTTAAPETTAPTEQSGEYEIVSGEGYMRVLENLNVRTKPSTDGEKVGTLKAGDIVTVTGVVSNGWVRIEYNGGEYFVSGDYLTAVVDGDIEDGVPYENVGALTGVSGYSALNYPEQKAVWFAYLDIDEMLRNADRSSFTSKIASAFDEVKSLGCNTVYVHVRSFGDAYYNSAYFPFTAAYSDTLGVAPGYDPLEIMISEAHARGLSFHAWVNPMRTTSKDRYAEMSDSYTLKQWYNSDSTNGTFMVYDRDTDYYWLSPAYPAVRQLICNGISEIILNYNVDGIHIDDYFYPTTSSSFDKAAFEASGASDRASWRRSVVSSLVKEIYSTVKSCNSSVLFGVSPQGNIENNTDRLYADVAEWCSKPGYLDYVVPQIYYGFNDKLAFDAAAKQWAELCTCSSVRLVCGIAAYKVGVNSEWSSGKILSKQTDYIADMSRFSGVAYYRHGSVFGSANSSSSKMKSEIPGLKSSISEF